MNPSPLLEAQVRASELWATWLSRPSNYRPPREAPIEAHAEHRARWERSAEYAHAQQIIRAAVDAANQPEPANV